MLAYEWCPLRQIQQISGIGILLDPECAGQVEKSIYSAEYQQLCVLLRTLRREAGLTQVEVAERLDVPQSFVSKYESGERRLDVIELRHVVQAIGTTVETVMSQLT
jgi:predicted transcriptional regulator